MHRLKVHLLVIGMVKCKTLLIALGLVAMLAIPALASIPASAQPSDVNFVLKAPVSDRNVFYGGSVMPVKFQLTDSSGTPITTATAVLLVDGQPATATGQKNTGDAFALQGNTYVYKLDTKPLAAGPGSPSHTLEIVITLEGGATFTETIGPIALH